MSDQTIYREEARRIQPIWGDQLHAAMGANPIAVICLGYFLIGGLFLAATGDNPLDMLLGIGGSFMLFLQLATKMFPWWIYALAALPVVIVPGLRQRIWEQKLQGVAAIVYCTLFVMVFGNIKNSLPGLVPFWADPMFTRMDEVLHFGHTPHELLGWLSGLNLKSLSGLYMNLWVFPATYLPMLLIVFDGNAARRRQFIILWACAWILLGNIIALAFMSTGPIFQDLLPGGLVGSHMSALEMLERPDAQGLIAVKHHLWASYMDASNVVGSGISAFPSVHVGMATVLGLYIARIGHDGAKTMRLAGARRVLRHGSALAGMAIIGVFLVLSVYLGWHFAVDGYASILVICGIYAWLTRQG